MLGLLKRDGLKGLYKGNEVAAFESFLTVWPLIFTYDFVRDKLRLTMGLTPLAYFWSALSATVFSTAMSNMSTMTAF